MRQLNSNSTVTSLQIAQSMDYSHKRVLVDIDQMLAALPKDLSTGIQPELYFEDGSTVPSRLYTLDRDSMYCLLTGYRPELLEAIIKRTEYLEARLRPAAARP